MNKNPSMSTSKLPWAATLLTGICIGLAFLFHFRWTRPISRWPIDLPKRQYAFTDHPELRDFDDPAAGESWEKMVRHEWWDSRWRDDTGRQFPRGIDVFHKMHCLVAIRQEFADMLTQTDGRQASKHEHSKRRSPKLKLVLNKNHLEHCFDFLRQDMLCAADMTLEPMTEDYQVTNGEGIVHECRDWRLLLNHMHLPDFDEI